MFDIFIFYKNNVLIILTNFNQKFYPIDFSFFTVYSINHSVYFLGIAAFRSYIQKSGARCEGKIQKA